MFIYLLQTFFIAFAGIAFHPNRSMERRRNYIIFVFVLLTLVSGIRAFSVGADTQNYVDMFNSTQYVGILNTRIEMGFMAYLKFLHIFSDDPGILLFVSSAICVGSACLFTSKCSKDPVMSMMLYMLMGAYFSQMNVMRQSLALSFTEIAFLVLLAGTGIRRKVISALLILLASTFHTMAFVAFIPFVLIIRRERSSNFANQTVGIMLFRSLMWSVAGFIGYSIIMRITGILFPQYAYYFSSIWSDANYNASLFAVLISAVFAVAGVIIFRDSTLDSVQHFAAVMMGLSLVFNVLSMRMEIWSRIAGMFTVYVYLLWVPEFTSEVEDDKNRWILNFCIILFALAYMLIILIFRPEWSRVVPYLVRR